MPPFLDTRGPFGGDGDVGHEDDTALGTCESHVVEDGSHFNLLCVGETLFLHFEFASFLKGSPLGTDYLVACIASYRDQHL